MREGPDDITDVEILEAELIDPAQDCNGFVRKEDRGNAQYAWWYLVNGADRDATVTIRRTWRYEGQIRSDTKQHSLYPGEEREVFSFDRAQEPKLALVACRLS